MKKEVAKLFKNYFEQQKKYKKIYQTPIDQIENKDLKKFEALKSKLGTKEFDSLYQELNSKYGFIVNKMIFEEKENQICSIYQSLRLKADHKLKETSFKTEMKTYYYVHQIEKQILDILTKARMGLIDFDSLILLNNITFEDEINDINVLQTIENHLNIIITNNLYVKVKCSSFESPLNWLTYDNGTYFMNFISFDKVIKIKTEMEKIKEEYIPFTQFLKLANFIGAEKIYSEEKILFIYKNICLRVKENRLSMDISLINLSTLKKLPNEETILYQDEDYITNRLLDQINDTLEEIEGKQR